MKRLLILTLSLLLLAVPGQAAVPRTLNVQGVLTDAGDDPLPDASYTVQFNLYDSNIGNGLVWSEEFFVAQTNGVFNAVLGKITPIDPDIFTDKLWLSMVIDGGSPTSPRVEMTSVASSIIASAVAPDAAVRSLNGLTNNVTLQGGANVSITQVDTTLVISTTGGSGGDDGDWNVSGDDLYRPTGRVYVGSNTPPPAAYHGEETKALDPATSKMTVVGTNEGFRSIMNYNTGPGDGEAAIFARRQRFGDVNPGSGFGLNSSNNAIVGYNDWSESYTFGVTGYAWMDDPYSGAVMGAHYNGSLWASLAYKDDASRLWGVYTNAGIFAGSTVETPSLIAASLRVTTGATDGFILTSDGSGNATWQAPGSSGADSDWGYSGNDLVRSSTGTVAIGTTDPHSYVNISNATTMQISAPFLPALCLDVSNNGDLTRWTILGTDGPLSIRKDDSYNSFGVRSASFDDGKVEFFSASDVPTIKFHTGDGMSSGSSLNLYSPTATSSLSMIELDTAINAGNNGGTLTLRDTFGESEVVITGNHNNTAVGRITTPVLEITGGSDLSEQFDLGDVSALTKPGMVVSIDPSRPGKLTLSGGAYDRKVAGVISGAGGVNTGMVMGQKGSVADGEYPVALVGRVYVWADASNGPITPGDMLTTSEMPGHAMKVLDHTQATGAVLGKAMTGLAEGQGLVLTLVSLQ